ncbi:hypothetical protein Mal64_13380 [Pseudobythopirellula maris]|uniref:Dockerin domain-containing protein n=1 Tax=Pseudobythopirellula maris TaxID=2527991 RepID=A0A5C5ZU34_9BACT|nr:dockerin type I repeat-containing protein [Pseudobythopirellula maris]TWT90939.1 hypothetical protein Mal64_13380 [Pseudobythopirellula maris]
MAPSTAVLAGAVIIEPDDYAEDTVLNDIHPSVELRIYDAFINENFPERFGEFPAPHVIDVRATTSEDIFGGYFTSTGVKGFSHAGIDYFSESRQLAMRFVAAASSVTIDFIGTSSLSAQVGVLEVYSPTGAFLQRVETAQLYAHEVEPLSITRPGHEIGYARAFSHDDFSPFGNLDRLRFNTPTPGDGNGDGRVDAADFTVWRDHLDQQVTPYTLGDFDGSGVVTTADYDLWVHNFSAGGSSPAAASAPEPSGLLIAAALAIATQLSSRRRV